jgi:thiol-disulfide isomerase/thioredoxin
MAVSSPLTPLGTPLPEVTLPGLDGRSVRLTSGRPVLLVFACNHCPYVKHVEQALGELVAGFPDLAVHAVASNDVEQYPDDDIPHLREQVARAGWTFTYLLDADQSLARSLGAVCTPDFFLFDAAGRLAYRGALDGSTPGNGQPLTGDDLRAAIVAVLAGQPVPQPQRPALGCSIKWKGE